MRLTSFDLKSGLTMCFVIQNYDVNMFSVVAKCQDGEIFLS
jgi:hypothetical protein